MTPSSHTATDADAALELLTGLQLNASQAARALGVQREAVPTWVNRGVGFPTVVRTAGSRSFYAAADVARWALERESLALDLDRFLFSACLDGLENVLGTTSRDRLDLLALLLLAAAYSDIVLVGAFPEQLRSRLVGEAPEVWSLCAADYDVLTEGVPAQEWDVLTRLAAVLAEHSWTPGHDYLRMRAAGTRRHAGRQDQPLPDPEVCGFLTALASWAEDGAWGGPVVLRGTEAALHWGALATASTPELSARLVDATGAGERASRHFRRVQALLDAEAMWAAPAADDAGAVAGADYLLALPLKDGHADAAARLTDQWRQIEDVLVGTTPGRTVLVLGRRDVLVDPVGRVGGEGAALKRVLYTDGSVRAAVVLGPRRAATVSGQALAVLVMRLPEPSGRPKDPHVFVADLTGRPLSVEDPRSAAGRVVHDVTTYLPATAMAQHTQQHGEVVRARTFVDRGLHHAPDHMVRLRAPEDPAELLSAALAAARRLEELTRPLLPAALELPLSVRTSGHDDGRHLSPATRTLGERVKAGRRTPGEELRHLPGHRLRPEDVVEATDPAPAQRPVLGAPELSGHRSVGSRVIGLDVLAAGYPRVRLTEPGDVVVLDGPEPRVLVDRAGSSVVETPCAVLRLPRGRRGADRAAAAPEVFAELVRAALEDQARKGSPRGTWQYARLPEHLAFAEDYDDALRRLGELERTLQERLQDIDDLKRTVRRGVHARVLQLDTSRTTTRRASGQNE